MKSRSHRDRRTPRILTAVPICDGHDSAIVTINLEFARHGVEVIYVGYHRSVRDIVRAAIQEDVRAIGISSYNGGHIEFLSDLLRSLRSKGAGNMGVFAGGGGTITPADARVLKRRGVDEIFFAGTPLETIVEFVKVHYSEKHPAISRGRLDRNLNDFQLSRLLTAVETGSVPATLGLRPSAFTIGITGPGGAGKTTLIDELVLRFLKSRPGERLAILSHDPNLGGKGALLGDRAAMVYAHDDRVFARSLGTRGKTGGLASATRSCIEILKRAGFALVLVESTGIGQEDVPFAQGLVDKRVLVMSPEYGSRLQLQKIVMLEAADIVVVNKTDLPGARTALAELEQRLGSSNQKRPKLIGTMAKRHGDVGVDALFAEVFS